jgi:hypothetical protein
VAPASAGDSLLPPKPLPHAPTDHPCLTTVVIPPCHNTHDDHFTHPHQRSTSRHPTPRLHALTNRSRSWKWKRTKKENVNQNPKIAGFPIQNNVCFRSSLDQARRLYDHFPSLARIRGVKVETGEFGATMEVDLVNDGPVTIILDSRET